MIQININYIKIQSLYGKDMDNYIEQSTIFATVNNAQWAKG